MQTFTRYDFGYAWPVLYGYLIPLTIFGALALVGALRQWRWWITAASALFALWSAGAMVLMHVAFGINSPQRLPTDAFLRSGKAHVLDVGAGSGRSAVGVLLSRPQTHVTGLDLYDGFFGIVGNTPERFMANARIAGAAARADARKGDMRALPFADATFDAAVSSYAIDHLPRRDIGTALGEVARVVRPGGEFLLMIVNVDLWARIVSPHAIAHHRRQNPAEWRAWLESAGFSVLEDGTRPMTYYFLARRH